MKYFKYAFLSQLTKGGEPDGDADGDGDDDDGDGDSNGNGIC